MDKEEIIRRLKKISEHAVHFSGEPPLILSLDDGIALHEAAELLKEQEAKSVIATTNAYGTRFYHCPKCNRDLYAYPRQLYCSNCGQKVKWND